MKLTQFIPLILLVGTFGVQAETECCDGVEFDPATEECCGGQVVELGKCCDDHPMEDDEECCYLDPGGPTIYTPATQCCDELGINERFDFSDYRDCPNRVEKPGFDPAPDGCSFSPDDPLWINPNCHNPHDTPIRSFAPACNNHDNCFAHCYTAAEGDHWATCNGNFYNDIISICNGLTDPACKTDCVGWANTYYQAVSATRYFYDTAQNEQCQCCPDP